jgi:hypothetical protein
MKSPGTVMFAAAVHWVLELENGQLPGVPDLHAAGAAAAQLL